MISKLQLESMKSITPTQMSDYLSSNGWHEDGRISDVAVIWHRSEKEFYEYEIIQPLRIDLKDYKQRVYELVTLLVTFENRGFIDIAGDINNFPADSIKIRVVHDDVEGGIVPVADVVSLIENTKKLLLSVATSIDTTYDHSSSGEPSKEIAEFIETMSLGQTEEGNYMVNIIAPVAVQGNAQKPLKSSVGRAVLTALAKSLYAIERSIGEYKRSGDISSFNLATEKGVNADLCDALAGLGGKSHMKDIHIRLSLSKAKEIRQELPLKHIFNTSNIPYLEKISKYYREKYMLNDQTIPV